MKNFTAIAFIVFSFFANSAIGQDISLTCFHSTKPEIANVSIFKEAGFLEVETVRVSQGKPIKGSKIFKLLQTGGSDLFAQAAFTAGSSTAEQDTLVLKANPLTFPTVIEQMFWIKTTFKNTVINPSVKSEAYSFMATESE